MPHDADDAHVLDEFLAVPLGQSWWERFREGCAAPWQGLRFLNRHPTLWRYAILPTLLNLLITVLVLAVLIASATWFVSNVHSSATTGLSGWQWWAAVAAEIAVGIVLLVVCGVAAVITWKFLTGVLCGYFYAKLAEEVESLLGNPSVELRSISFFYEIVNTALHLTLLIVVNVVFLLMNLAPVVGSAISLVGSTSFTWYLLGLDYLGFPLAMRGKRRIEQFQFGRRHWDHTLGLGATVFLLEFVPLLGALLLTTAVVGGVLLHRRIETAELDVKKKSTRDMDPADLEKRQQAEAGTTASKGDMTIKMLRSELRGRFGADDDLA